MPVRKIMKAMTVGAVSRLTAATESGHTAGFPAVHFAVAAPPSAELPAAITSCLPFRPPATLVCLLHQAPREALALRKLEEQGYEVFLPLLTQWEKARDGWTRKQQVMFPRYAFVRCGRLEQSIAPIRSTPGVTGLVTFGTIPATLDEATLEAIRALVDSQARALDEKKFPFQAGDTVEIADGPLKGMSGIVSAVAAERVTVLLSLLGREKPVAIPTGHLRLS
jgi:transcriptional antiterminator RfaH